VPRMNRLKMNFPFLLFAVSFLIGLFSGAREAHAYPELIRLGYVQCQACHTSSLGGGLLNAYGKSVRTSLSAIQRKEEKAFDSAVNANLFMRYLWIESSKQKDHFLMQTDVAVRADVSKDYGFETIVGLVPERVRARSNAPKGLLGKSFVVRRLLVDRNFGEGAPRLVFGRDFIPRSTNTEDHTSYLRSYGRQGVTDTPTQLRLELADDFNLTHLGVFGPSGEENSNAREWGAFGRYERTLKEKWSVGGSLVAGQTTELQRIASDIFTRVGFTQNLGALVDFQWVERKQRGSGTRFGQGVIFLEPFFIPTEWSMVRYRMEKLYRAEPFSENAFKHSLALQLKLISELSVIGAIEKTRVNQRWSDSFFTIQLFAQL
jgi:hypothetical protein